MTRAVNVMRSGRTGEEDGREAALLDRVVRVELEPERVAFRRDDRRKSGAAEDAVFADLPGAQLRRKREAVVFAVLLERRTEDSFIKTHFWDGCTPFDQKQN